MKNVRMSVFAITGLMAAGLVGCAPKMTMEDMKEMRPERPAALNHLDAFVGTWEGKATMTMKGMDEPIVGHGKSTISWDCDNWVLVERNEFEMEGMGEMKGIGLWTYSTKDKKFHTCWADSMGGWGTGVVTYDADENEWEYKVKSHSPHGNTTGKGDMTLTGDTMTWDWSEFAMFGLVKVMEMEGESHRM